MPRPKKPATWREYNLQLGAPVVQLMEEEASYTEVSASRGDFLRMLLRKKAGLLEVTRSPNAPARKPLGATRTPPRQRCMLAFDAATEEILLELANRCGTKSKSTIVSHLVLEWIGISPLTAGFPFKPRKAVTTRSATNRRTLENKTVTLNLAEPVWALLDDEAARLGYGIGPSLLRAILLARMGLAVVERPAVLDDLKPLPNEVPQAKGHSIKLPTVVDGFIGEVSNMLGAGERQAIVSHFVLEWMGISPLTPGFALSSGR